MAKASGLFPATRLKVSSTAAGAAGGPEPRLRGLEADPEPRPPRERRLEGAGPGPDGRCGGGRGKEEWGRLAPVPRPAPPPRASFDEPPYIETERRRERERDLKGIVPFRADPFQLSSLGDRPENKSGLFFFIFLSFSFSFLSFFLVLSCFGIWITGVIIEENKIK